MHGSGVGGNGDMGDEHGDGGMCNVIVSSSLGGSGLPIWWGIGFMLLLTCGARYL